MGKFGSQTSTYNRLVTVFVAIGSMVGHQNVVFSCIMHSNVVCRVDRLMATVLPSSPVLSVSRVGSHTLIFPSKMSRVTTRSRRPPLPLPMGSSALAVLLARFS